MSAKKKTPTQDAMIYCGPGWAWTTIWETIQMDMKSSAFDPELRKSIKRALDTISYVGSNIKFKIPKDAERDRIIDLAKAFYVNGSDDNVSIDRDAKISVGEDGCWVSGWMFVGKNDYALTKKEKS